MPSRWNWPRSPTKRSAKLAGNSAKYGIKAAFSDYRQILMEQAWTSRGDPSSMHYQMSRMPWQQENVVRKPFVLTAAGQRLKQIADERGVMIVEASQHHLKLQGPPADVKSWVRHNAIFNYTQYSRYDAFLRGEIAPAFDPSRRRGFALDLNVYNSRPVAVRQPESLVST